MSQLQYIAEETGGKFYYAYCRRHQGCNMGVQEDTIGEIDKTDTDGDGL